MLMPKYREKDKHKDPWQPGRKGTLCSHGLTTDDHEVLRGTAQALLDEATNEAWERGRVRYAPWNGRAYAARPHAGRDDQWYGFPVGYVEVPQKIWMAWVRLERICRADVQRWWTLETR